MQSSVQVCGPHSMEPGLLLAGCPLSIALLLAPGALGSLLGAGWAGCVHAGEEGDLTMPAVLSLCLWSSGLAEETLAVEWWVSSPSWEAGGDCVCSLLCTDGCGEGGAGLHLSTGFHYPESYPEFIIQSS